MYEIAISTYGELLKIVPFENKTLKICKLAVEQSPYALKYVPYNLKTTHLCRNAINVGKNKLLKYNIDNKIYPLIPWSVLLSPMFYFI
jgi:hypothetical protein